MCDPQIWIPLVVVLAVLAHNTLLGGNRREARHKEAGLVVATGDIRHDTRICTSRRWHPAGGHHEWFQRARGRVGLGTPPPPSLRLSPPFRNRWCDCGQHMHRRMGLGDLATRVIARASSPPEGLAVLELLASCPGSGAECSLGAWRCRHSGRGCRRQEEPSTSHGKAASAKGQEEPSASQGKAASAKGPGDTPGGEASDLAAGCAL